MPVHRREIDQRDGGHDARKHAREPRSAGLRGRQAHARLPQRGQVGGVAGREQRVGHGPERYAVIEEAACASENRASRVERRPCETQSGRHVVRVGVDGLEELQIVPHAQVQRDGWRNLPFVLHVHTEVRIRLRNAGGAERLSEAGVVVHASEKVRERRERVASAHRAGIGDLVVIVENVETQPHRMWPRLVRQVVHDLIEMVPPGGGASRHAPERGDARNTHGGTHGVGRKRLQIAVSELSPGFEHGSRRQRHRVTGGDNLVAVVEAGGGARRVQPSGSARVAGVGVIQAVAEAHLAAAADLMIDLDQVRWWNPRDWDTRPWQSRVRGTRLRQGAR